MLAGRRQERGGNGVVNDWLAVLVDERERLHAGGMHSGEPELRDGRPVREAGVLRAASTGDA